VRCTWSVSTRALRAAEYSRVQPHVSSQVPVGVHGSVVSPSRPAYVVDADRGGAAQHKRRRREGGSRRVVHLARPHARLRNGAQQRPSRLHAPTPAAAAAAAAAHSRRRRTPRSEHRPQSLRADGPQVSLVVVQQLERAWKLRVARAVPLGARPAHALLAEELKRRVRRSDRIVRRVVRVRMTARASVDAVGVEGQHVHFQRRH